MEYANLVNPVLDREDDDEHQTNDRNRECVEGNRQNHLQIEAVLRDEVKLRQLHLLVQLNLECLLRLVRLTCT